MPNPERRAKVFITAQKRADFSVWGVEAHPVNRKAQCRITRDPNANHPEALLKATLSILSGVKPGANIEIISSSSYITVHLEEDLPFWASNNWRNRQGRRIKNEELWEKVFEGLRLHTVTARRCRTEEEVEVLARLSERCRRA